MDIRTVQNVKYHIQHLKHHEGKLKESQNSINMYAITTLNFTSAFEINVKAKRFIIDSIFLLDIYNSNTT